QFEAIEMERAVHDVVHSTKSVRSAARENNVDRTTLSRYVRDVRTKGIEGFQFKQSFVTKQVFTNDEEGLLASYLIQCFKIFYGLTRKGCQNLAFRFAKANNKTNIPPSWFTNNQAGKDWLSGFLSRQQDLSLRLPEATSLARSISFNKHNVELFFNNLEEVLKRSSYQPRQIWNLDETGITTVQKPSRVISQKGLKQVGQITSAERGTFVTMCCCVNAAGQALPPVYIFPRVHFKDHMLFGSPSGSLGLAAQSGWMNSEMFTQSFVHFINHMGVFKSNPGILVIDNHKSHLSLDIIKIARDNGVRIVTFPPHCSHRLQPLDVSVYGPFKTYYNAACS
uniref:DDE-1 domain-containing protein n=1 Tax=Ciona savignyi TaxID=51511 RepID=H2YFC2_CIOSA